MEASRYRPLPSVDKVLSDKRIIVVSETFPHETVVSLIRQCLENARLAIAAGGTAPSFPK